MGILVLMWNQMLSPVVVSLLFLSLCHSTYFFVFLFLFLLGLLVDSSNLLLFTFRRLIYLFIINQSENKSKVLCLFWLIFLISMGMLCCVSHMVVELEVEQFFIFYLITIRLLIIYIKYFHKKISCMKKT